jgi:hypothetical protein
VNRQQIFSRAAIAMIVATAVPSSASSQEAPQSYDATYVLASGAGVSKMSEKLTLRRTAPVAFMSVSNDSGAVLTTPTKFGDDGEIEGAGSDPAVACYNTAAAAIYANRHTPNEPSAVYVRLAGGVVRVPLTLRETASGSTVDYVGAGQQDIALDHDGMTIPAALAVQAHFRVRGDAIANVAVDEVTVVGNATTVLARQRCVLNESSGSDAAPQSESTPSLS